MVRETPLDSPALAVAGIDVSYHLGTEARAAVVVLSFPAMQLVDTSVAALPVRFPYSPGLLGFREIPSMLEALQGLQALPDVLLCDGHGRAHPSRFGMASHLGLLLDHPTVGCAKSPLVGRAVDPLPGRGSVTWLYDGDEIIGSALRTQHMVKPVYVSIGHRMDLETAVGIVLRCAHLHRLPEPLRLAHLLASERWLSEEQAA